MGEYWKPVNVTRKEWIHPHHADEGLKWGEWTHPESNVVRYMKSAWADTDVIYAVSDYEGLKRIDRSATEIKAAKSDPEPPTYDELDDWGTEVGAQAECKRCFVL